MRPNPLFFGGNPFGGMHPQRQCLYGGVLVKCSDGVYRPEREAAAFLLQEEKQDEPERKDTSVCE